MQLFSGRTWNATNCVSIFLWVLLLTGFVCLGTPKSYSQAAVADVDQLDGRGFSRLHRAASGGNVDLIRKLLAEGANVDVPQGTYQGTPLQYAASAGQTAAVQALIEGGANLEAKDSFDRTPLIWAAMEKRTEAVRVLLDAGANINAQPKGGWTPLHFAISKNDKATTQLLLKRGANAELKDSGGAVAAEVDPEYANPKAKQRRVITPNYSAAAATKPVEEELIILSTGKPSDLIATINGAEILRSDLEPPAEWQQQRAEHLKKHGATRGLESPDVYAFRTLHKRIWDAVIGEFKKTHDTVPTEQELAQFTIHSRKARQRSEKETKKWREGLRDQIEEDRKHAVNPDLDESLRDSLKHQLKDREEQLAMYEETAAKMSMKTPEMEKFFANWYVGNWKLQHALYKEYGGRAIFQQVGPEAVDAMRDLFKENELDGVFAIYDEKVKERFWRYFVDDKMHVFIPDPERIFAYPWSSFEDRKDTAGKD